MDIGEIAFCLTGAGGFALLMLGVVTGIQDKVFHKWMWGAGTVSVLVAACILTGHAWGYY